MMRFLLLMPAIGSILAASVFGQAGVSFCTPFPNSTGTPTALTGSFGNGVGSGLHLEVTDGVPGQFGYVLVGNEATSGVLISNGVFCLVGTPTAQMFRYNIAGGAHNSSGNFDNQGVFQNSVGTSLVGSGFDVPDTIPASLFTPILAGSTWHFQVWHRDDPAGAGTSTFSNGLSVTFQAGPTPLAGMVSIPAGSFDMGSNAAAGLPYEGGPETQPVHTVTISQEFWMAATETTQDQYEGVMGTNPSHFSGGSNPVEFVSWHEARAYCAALTAQEQAAGNIPLNMEYRLPTEAEWEYACRAGTTTEYNVGQTIYCFDAKLRQSYHNFTTCAPHETTAVASYAPNAWGLYDMHGNVSEWCLDSYVSYAAGAVTDPFVTGSTLRVKRGGSWNDPSATLRSAWRGSMHTTTSFIATGFRVVLSGILVP